DSGVATFQDGDHGVGGPQIDSHGAPHHALLSTPLRAARWPMSPVRSHGPVASVWETSGATSNEQAHQQHGNHQAWQGTIFSSTGLPRPGLDRYFAFSQPARPFVLNRRSAPEDPAPLACALLVDDHPP